MRLAKWAANVALDRITNAALLLLPSESRASDAAYLPDRSAQTVSSHRRMTMTVLPKIALPLSAFVILALSGCNTGSVASHVGATATATTQQPASGGATASGGSGPPSPAASSHLHACRLVSEQDATTALGADPGTGHEDTQESAFGGSSRCNYQTVSGGVQVSASSIAGKALCDGNRQPNSVDVPGVGDGAFETPATSAQEVTVYFLKGDTCVSITIESPASMGSPKDLVVALATTAAGRL